MVDNDVFNEDILGKYDWRFPIYPLRSYSNKKRLKLMPKPK